MFECFYTRISNSHVLSPLPPRLKLGTLLPRSFPHAFASGVFALESSPLELCSWRCLTLLMWLFVGPHSNVSQPLFDTLHLSSIAFLGIQVKKQHGRRRLDTLVADFRDILLQEDFDLLQLELIWYSKCISSRHTNRILCELHIAVRTQMWRGSRRQSVSDPCCGTFYHKQWTLCRHWCCCEGSLMQKLKPDFEIALLVVTTARNMCSQPAIAARKLLKRELARMLGWEGARDKSQAPFRA